MTATNQRGSRGQVVLATVVVLSFLFVTIALVVTTINIQSVQEVEQYEETQTLDAVHDNFRAVLSQTVRAGENRSSLSDEITATVRAFSQQRSFTQTSVDAQLQQVINGTSVSSNQTNTGRDRLVELDSNDPRYSDAPVVDFGLTVDVQESNTVNGTVNITRNNASVNDISINLSTVHSNCGVEGSYVIDFSNGYVAGDPCEVSGLSPDPQETGGTVTGFSRLFVSAGETVTYTSFITTADTTVIPVQGFESGGPQYFGAAIDMTIVTTDETLSYTTVTLSGVTKITQYEYILEREVSN